MSEIFENPLIQDIPHAERMRVQHILSHCLIPHDGRSIPIILDSGCGNGVQTFLMAALSPHMRFIGFDRNPQAIDRANRKYGHLPNLHFVTADITSLPFAGESVDCVICSRMLGPIFTRHHYDERSVRQTLQTQLQCLKPNGAFILYDMMAWADDQYVLLEIPMGRKVRDEGDAPDTIRESDRVISNLIWFHDHARPKQKDGCEGFFLEELPQKLPFTRLFRMPAKWAYEFITRHECFGERFRKNISLEMTCLNEAEICSLLPTIGASVDYTAPWVSSYVIDNYYKPCFKLYNTRYLPLPYPATGHIFVSHKRDEKARMPVTVRERKQAKTSPQNLTIQTIQDEGTGEVHDLITTDPRHIHIIPYQTHAAKDGETPRTTIYLEARAARAIANIVPRNSPNLDGREWSGYIPSALRVDGESYDDAVAQGNKGRFTLLKKKFGIRQDLAAQYEDGPRGYPAPDMVETMIETFFLPLHEAQSALKGSVSAFDLDDVLRAIAAGLIPDAWLEVQLTNLQIQIQGQRNAWMSNELPLGNEAPPADRIMRVEDIMAQMDEEIAELKEQSLHEGDDTDSRYRDTRGNAGQLKALRSIFVEEGWGETGLNGVSAKEFDFAIPTDKSANKAAILSLTRDLDGNAMAGFDFQQMPVPYRMGQKEKMINLPTVSLPDTISTMDDAKEFLAKKFDTSVDKVVPMGPSFFSCIDYTPERIYPFAIARSGGWAINPNMFYAPIMDLWIFDETDFKWSFLYKWGGALVSMSQLGSYGGGYASRTEENQRRFDMIRPQKAALGDRPGQWTSRASRNDNKAVSSGTAVAKPRKHAI